MMDGKDGDKTLDRRSKDFLSPVTGTLEKTPSLHGLHAQSSTETSGLGETVTSGFSSQESIHSGRSGTVRIKDELEKDEGIATHSGNPEKADNQHMQPNRTVYNTNTVLDLLDEQRHARAQPRVKYQHDLYQHDLDVPIPDENDENFFDELFSKNKIYDQHTKHSIVIHKSSPTFGLQIKQIDSEWDRRSSNRSSMNSLSSAGNRSNSRTSIKRFLGKSTESAWMKWSRERRASFNRRIQLLEKPEVPETERASTPIKKARQEGLKFIHPDLEGKYLTEDDIKYIRQHRLQKIQTYSVIEKSRKIPLHSRTEVQLSPTDWHALSYFWEHVLFIRSRYFAILFNFISLIFMSLSISNETWVQYSNNETGVFCLCILPINSIVNI